MRRLWLSIALLTTLAHPAAAQDRVVTMLAELVNAPGAPGFEDSVRHLMVNYMKPMATKLTYDGIGSVIAQQGTTGPRIMVDAHMDELGGVVRRVTPTGFLSMQMLGGWFDQALVDQRWVIIGSKGPVHAVTGIRDIHIAAPEERTRVFPRDVIFLDVGATSDAQVKAMGIAPGDPVVPDAPFACINGTNNYLAKAWDDRIGLAVLIEVMRRMEHTSHANTIYYAATVQEEIGLRGGQTSASIVKPDIGIALEAGVVKDVPGVQAEEAQEVLGGGSGLVPLRCECAAEPEARGVRERDGCGGIDPVAIRFHHGVWRGRRGDAEDGWWCADRQPRRAYAVYPCAQRHHQSRGFRSHG